MSETVFTYDVFLSHSAKDKAVVRASSLSASNGDLSSLGNCERNLAHWMGQRPAGPSERAGASHWAGVRCRSPLAKEIPEAGLRLWFEELPVAASRQSAANFSEKPRIRKDKDGGALPRRRYAEKIKEGLEHSRAVPLAHRMGEGSGGAANASEFQPSAFSLQPLLGDPRNKERRFIPRVQTEENRTDE